MEPDEIGVVLARASELHSRISDAIERALKTDFLLSRVGRSPNRRDAENASSSPTSEAGYGGNDSYGKGERLYSESDAYDGGAVAGDGSAEARSLGAIGDALEVLAEQLEALQTVQQQQRSEKDAALAELEESRRVLLKCLKEHRGREWEVVHEALAFAGEPVEERDDLPLPPYPMPLSDPSFIPTVEDHSSPYHGPAILKHNGSMKKLALGPGQAEDINYVGIGRSEDENQEESPSQKVYGGLLGIPVGFAKVLFAHAFGLTRKAAIVVVSVAAALAVSEVSHRLEKRRSIAYCAPKMPTAPPPIATPHQLPPECPPGKKLIMEDGFLKCIVKERVELPFPKEIKTPDVLYGRG